MLVSTSAIAGLSFLSFNALAADPDPIIVVTATRTSQTADETLASVTVITREDIERSQAQSVADLLRGEPGLSIVNTGGTAKLTSIFLRGTESDHVLVLIDGIKAGSATAGTTAFENIPLAQIERIEIVRGPRSSLYGSEAIGGVIQIFTRKGGGPLSPYFSVTAGSYRTYEGTVGISGGGRNGWFNASAAGFSTSGFNACDGTATAGCYTVEPDDDGSRRRSGSMRAGYRFGARTEADVFWLRADGKSEYDGGFQNRTQTVQESYGSRVRITPFAPWQITLAGGRSFDFSDNFLNDVLASRFNTRRDTVSVQNDVSFGASQMVSLGYDYQDDHVTNSVYTVASRDNQGVFGQYQGQFGWFNSQLAYRRDNNEQFGRYDTGNLGLGADLANHLHIFVTYGTAFKAPTFNELYYPFSGNPALTPETSRSAEAGVRGQSGKTRWSLAAFQTVIDDLISYDASISAVANINEARIRGIETTLATRVGAWDSRTVLTILDPENRSTGPNRGNDLPRRTRESLRLDLDRDVGPGRLGVTLRGEGPRYDDLANTVELKRYATLDLRGEYHVARDWTVQARIENLLDKDYETVALFNQPGRSAYLTVRYQLQRQ